MREAVEHKVVQRDKAPPAPLCHETDGFIFYKTKERVTPGTTRSLLKWKPQELNTVDFLCKTVQGVALDADGNEAQAPVITALLHVRCRGSLAGFIHREPLAMKGKAAVIVAQTRDDGKRLRDHEGKILECVFSKETNTWEVHGVRTDKTHPNGEGVAHSIMSCLTRPMDLAALQKLAGLPPSPQGVDQTAAAGKRKAGVSEASDNADGHATATGETGRETSVVKRARSDSTS